jgi:hypothetical protein
VPLELHPLCTAEAELADPITIGAGPAGVRLVYEVLGATFTGDRLRGTLKGRAAADWVTLSGPIGTLDVRLTVETHDGAFVFVQYRGRLNVAAGGPIYVAPLFETGDERYSWLNAVQAVGKGELSGSLLRYEWFEVR